MRLLVMLLLAVAPLIVFSVLAAFLPHDEIGVAALAGVVMIPVAGLASRPVWPPDLFSSCLLILFAVVAVLGFALGADGESSLAAWSGGGTGIVAGLVVLVLVPVRPLTEQFARDVIPRAFWSSPVFGKVNRLVSTAWGVALVAAGLCRVGAAALGQSASRRVPELVLGLIAPAAILLGALTFSHRHYRPIQ
jgi:hypothetical protein